LVKLDATLIVAPTIRYPIITILPEIDSAAGFKLLISLLKKKPVLPFLKINEFIILDIMYSDYFGLK